MSLGQANKSSTQARPSTALEGLYLDPSLVVAGGAPPGLVVREPEHFLTAGRAGLFPGRWLVIGR